MTAAGSDYVRRHLLFGWWSLLLFASLGLGLEAMHAFKVPLYLDVANETRRLMWTLGHAHGVLLALVHLAFAATLFIRIEIGARTTRVASALLMAASVLLPGGFLIGGIAIHGGDPNLGALVVPLGALLFLSAVFLTAWIVTSRKRPKGFRRRT